MNVGELRKALEGVSDEMEVIVISRRDLYPRTPTEAVPILTGEKIINDGSFGGYDYVKSPAFLIN